MSKAKYTYLKGTVRLRADGLPCMRINWKTGMVEEPIFDKVTDDRTNIEHLQMRQSREKHTPIGKFPMYPAFIGYLKDNNIYDTWLHRRRG